MDISTVIVGGISTVETISEELKPHCHYNKTINKTLKLPETTTKRDALKALKLDPAVLEAKLTVARSDKEAIGATFNNDSRPIAGTKDTREESEMNFNYMMMKYESALRSLTPDQFSLLFKYVDTLRCQRQYHQKSLECAFCKNNGWSLTWYSSHCLKDWRGEVLCPVLRSYRCVRCGATGKRAHTIKYCPM